MSDEDLDDFTENARKEFAKSLGRICTAFRDQARRISQDSHAETTSDQHVAEAYRLVSARTVSSWGPDARQAGRGAPRGGFPPFITMIATGQYMAVGVWISVVCCVIGGILTAASPGALKSGAAWPC
jgi:hypothetical protein